MLQSDESCLVYTVSLLCQMVSDGTNISYILDLEIGKERKSDNVANSRSHASLNSSEMNVRNGC